MKQVTLNIPDNKFPFFMELIKNLGLLKSIDSTSLSNKEQILKDIEESVHEVNLIKKGKLKGISAKKLLNEL